MKTRQIDEDDITPSAPAIPAPILSPAAFYGAIGHYVQYLAPYTEASPAAMLASALATVGALIGRGPTMYLDGAAHHARFFVLLCGPSAAGAKSTAMGRGGRDLVRLLDDDFSRARVTSGLSTGEGLIDAVRDGQPETETVDKKGERRMVPGDPGVQDKRLLVLEDEIGGVFQKLGREGNSLSAVLREAWDGRALRTLTRNNKLCASDPHIALVGCITPADLRQSLKSTEVLNGLANRFLLVWTNHAQLLPDGGRAVVPLDLQRALHEAVDKARRVGEMRWHEGGRALYREIYPGLRVPSAGGSLSALLARGAPQVCRLAMLYAALDGQSEISADHLRAAVAFWEYCSESTRYVYRTADSITVRQRRILDALSEAGPEGLNRTDIRRVVGSNNVSAVEIDRDLSALQETGLVTMRAVSKARTVWIHTHQLSGSQTSQTSQVSHFDSAEVELETDHDSQTSQHSHSQEIPAGVGPGAQAFDWSLLEERAA